MGKAGGNEEDAQISLALIFLFDSVPREELRHPSDKLFLYQQVLFLVCVTVFEGKT